MRVAVYSGSGVGPDSRAGFIAFLQWAGISWRDVTPEEVPRLRPEEDAGLFVPGGWADNYLRDISPAGKQNLRDFVAAGGFYVGICAGAFLAADIIRWEGRLFEYDLDLFKGLAYGPVDEIQPWRGWRLTSLDLEGEYGFHSGEKEQEALYWGGPAFLPHPDQAVDVVARYRATGDPAAVTFRYGKGSVLLSGCHVELGWDDGVKAFDLQGGHGAQWSWLLRVLGEFGVTPPATVRKGEEWT